MLKPVIALFCCMAVSAVEAQVRVIDSSPQSVRTGVSRQSESVEQKTETYNQIQSLLKEVSELRALVEEQGHELSRLKQLELDNYIDLDRRISFLTGNNSAKPKVEDGPSLPESSDTFSSVAPANTDVSEADEYKTAYDLLRQRQVDPSLGAFKSYLNKYPMGEFAANSCYWLGEIYLLKNQTSQAREWFEKLVQEFPSSNKVPDAKFKLGKAYHLMGDKKRAKPLLDEVSKGNGDAARLAQQYLKDNF